MPQPSIAINYVTDEGRAYYAYNEELNCYGSDGSPGVLVLKLHRDIVVKPWSIEVVDTGISLRAGREGDSMFTVAIAKQKEKVEVSIPESVCSRNRSIKISIRNTSSRPLSLGSGVILALVLTNYRATPQSPHRLSVSSQSLSADDLISVGSGW